MLDILIDTFWAVATQLIELIVPIVALYLVLNLMSSLLFKN